MKQIINIIKPSYLSRESFNPHLFRLTGLILSSLAFSTVSYGALSATTANTIKGTAPQFVTIGPNAVDLTDFKYFGLSYGGNDYYTPSQLGASLDAAGIKGTTTKHSDLYDGSPTSPLTLALGTPVSVEIIDSDGDGANPAPITEFTTGSVTLGWYYGAGAGTQLSSTDLNKSFCALAVTGISPYLKISGSINLNTTYGDPHNQLYPDATSGLSTTPSRKFNIYFGNSVCAARPDMTNATGNYAGPATEWNSSLGFLPQSFGKDNFPTTGSNNLQFDLIINGTDANSLAWTVNGNSGSDTVNGVTVAVSVTSSTQIAIKLTGPKASSFSFGATATAFTGPVSFNIEGKQGGSSIITYPFSIKKWYIHRGTHLDFASNQRTWCRQLGGSPVPIPLTYDLSNVYELTNRNTAGLTVPSGFPLNSTTNNGFQRRIGGGFFTEWGSPNGFAACASKP